MLRPRHVLPKIAFFAAMLSFTVSAWAGPSCQLNPANRTLTICAPANHSTVQTTFHVNAGVTDSIQIQYMQVYVNNRLYVTQNRNFIDADITVAATQNASLVVQAREVNSNFFIKTFYTINIVSDPGPLTLTPQNPTLSENAMQQFTVSPVTPVSWSASCGSINVSGNYTAPLVPGACLVKASATDGSGRSASTTATIVSPITITPPSASTVVNMTQQFSANAQVNWSASCGTINSGGLFTAPANAGTCTITATAASGTAYTAQAIDTVTNAAGISYTTWKNDAGRTGLNSAETILNLSNVNSANFGQLFKTTVDGGVWAQPLYMAGLTVNRVTHNVVFVETSNDSAYAIDADSGAPLWKVSFLSNGVTPVDGRVVNSTMGQIGITGTPVIDGTTNTIYFVAETAENGGTSYVHRLHALDVTSGQEKFGGPVVITSTGFQPKEQLQRPGLLLANGNVYIGFGSQGDTDPYHGWLFAYDGTSLGQSAAWNITSADGQHPRGAIWMGGSGIAADSAGNIYVATANGEWNGTTDLGQSVVKLSPALTVLDYFTPYNHEQQTEEDADLGSGGVLLVPDQAGPHPNEMVLCGKPAPIYVIDQNNLGHIGDGSDNVIQEVSGQLGGPGEQSSDACFTTAAYWNQNLYFIGNNDSLKMFSLSATTGLMSTTPVSKDTFNYAFPGGQAVVSSNGLSNAIVWGFDYTTGTLHAYDASDVSHVLYVSPGTGTGIKYSVPTVVNGRVYVGINRAIVGFGVTNQGSCAPPSSPGVNVCAPAAGQTYSSPVQVRAAGTDPTGNVNHMELWIDSQKINDYPGNMINTTVALGVGTHAATAIEVNGSGGYIKSSPVVFTVH
ncbi:MAG: Ig-like domain-containing protein [Acidobacteriaceae bacterium]